MNAAIYARKSTEQPGIPANQQSESVERQEEGARVFAAEKGWTVVDVFVDDGISGGEFQRREEFQRMLAAALKPQPPFQILIVSEQKSIGREASETGYVIKQLARAGVEIWDYMQKKSLTPRNAMDKAVSSIRAFGDESHREDTSRRVIETFTRKAQMGHVVGGRVFGYRNEDVGMHLDAHGRERRSHVQRVRHPEQAAVVLRIFQMFDSGLGLKKIAKILTAEGATSPIPFIPRKKNRPPPVKGFSPSTVKAILCRELYRGVVVWNRSRKRDDWGMVAQKPRDKKEWIELPADESLRIVPEDLWLRVASRRKDTEGRIVRFESGRLSGGPPKKDTKNMLSGLATCSWCGGGLIVETSPRKRGRISEYLCSRHRLNGSCANSLSMPVIEMNHQVLQFIEEHALTTKAIENVIHLSERDDLSDLHGKLATERKDTEKRIARLVAVIESGGDNPVSLVNKLRELEAKLSAIDDQRVALHPIPRLAPAIIEDRLAEWRRTLRMSTTQARTVIQRIVKGRITFTPHINPVSGKLDGYEFEAETRFDKLFTGIAVERPKSLGPELTGTEHFEAPYEADYGRLLDRVAGKRALGLASPPGFERCCGPDFRRVVRAA